jgi:hypothetical protein
MKTAPDERIIGFADLLGTSEFSHNEPRRFDKSLVAFTEALRSAATELNSGDVYFFSDCMYFEAKELRQVLVFLSYLRGELMAQGFFIKGAVRLGSLGVVTDGPGSAAGNVRGVTFRGNVVDVYSYQDALKGIGIRFDEDVFRRFGLRNRSVRSCHMPFSNNAIAESFQDLPLRPVDMNEKVLSRLLKDFFIAATRSRRYGRYYVTLLSTWIRSSSFAPRRKSKALKSLPPHVSFLLDSLLGRDFERYFGSVTGIEYVFFTLLDEVYRQNETSPTPALERVLDYFCQRKKLIGKLEVVPTGVLCRAARNLLLLRLSSTMSIAPPSFHVPQ